MEFTSVRPENEQVRNIPLDDIAPHPANRRIGGFNQEKLDQLAESIRAVGVQQPAVVRPGKDQPYELVAGERRWRASRIAGMDTLPCIVRNLDDATTLRIQLIENLQREDVHPLDEADGYSLLIQDGRYDVENVAAETGKSASYIYQRLKLRELIPSARKMLIDETITAGHAILIARLSPEQQERVIKEGLRGWGRDYIPSVRKIDEWIHSEILMDLSKAPWKKDDATVVAEAGSCTACTKRTGYAPALFADVGKKDHCLDRVCFAAKGGALVARRREELKGEEHLEVVDGYMPKTPAGALDRWEWTECKKKEEGSIKILVVGGATPGRITYGKARSTYSGRPTTPEAIAAQKEERAREKRVHKAAEAVRRTIYDTARKAFKETLIEKDQVPYPSLRHIEAGAIWDRLEWNSQKFLARHLGWDIPKGYSGALDKIGREKIDAMNFFDLDLFIFDMCFVPALQIVSGWSLRIPDKLRRAAGLVGIDLVQIISDIATSSQIKPEEIDPPEYPLLRENSSQVTVDESGDSQTEDDEIDESEIIPAIGDEGQNAIQ